MTKLYKRKAIQLSCFIICLSLAACSSPSNSPKDTLSSAVQSNSSNDISEQSQNTESPPSYQAKSTQTGPQIVIDEELQKWSSPQSQFTVSEGNAKLKLIIKNKSENPVVLTLSSLTTNEVYTQQEVPPHLTMSPPITRLLPAGDYNILWRSNGKAVIAHVKGTLYYK
ncbi:hypothetical protein [Paenibacillus wulumuqiensis]|uniref:hypothetical protein n=1 Tax=Paenibacillus wulumuqiensis TaxID=1567107 RepID=UPI00128C40C5|nr:hypothetical protein [Paenibacillus wulumuqiensis]